MNTRAVGARAEDAACTYLASNGYEILGRNLRLGRGELDIVARRGGVTAFIEVKCRRSARFGTPAEAVTPAKRRRILDAALCYAAQEGLMEAPLRFDVVEVTAGGVRHIQGAFDASELDGI